MEKPNKPAPKPSKDITKFDFEEKRGVYNRGYSITEEFNYLLLWEQGLMIYKDDPEVKIQLQKINQVKKEIYEKLNKLCPNYESKYVNINGIEEIKENHKDKNKKYFSIWDDYNLLKSDMGFIKFTDIQPNNEYVCSRRTYDRMAKLRYLTDLDIFNINQMCLLNPEHTKKHRLLLKKTKPYFKKPKINKKI